MRELKMMSADQKIVQSILAKDASAITEYHALSDDNRRKLLGELNTGEFRSLTRLIKKAKRMSFLQRIKDSSKLHRAQ